MATLSAETLAFIETCRIAHLATTDKDGHPHVIPVCFAYHDDAFWIAVDDKPKRTARLKRLRNIGDNPHVSLVFDRYDEDWSRLAYVLVHCKASVLEETAERAAVVAALRVRYPQYERMRLDGPLIRVLPERVVTWNGSGQP